MRKAVNTLITSIFIIMFILGIVFLITQIYTMLGVFFIVVPILAGIIITDADSNEHY